MPSRFTTGLRALLVAALVFALTVPAMPAVAGTDEGGSDISAATPLPGSPFTGALDAGPDAHDVFQVEVPAGQRLVLSLTGNPGTDFDLHLFAPSATTVLPPSAPIAYGNIGAYPHELVYDSSVTATYSVDLEAYWGSGAYTLTWEMYATPPPAPDDLLPGVALPPSPVVDSLSTAVDPDDVYSVPLLAGQAINVALTAADPDDWFVPRLLGPGASSLDSAPVAFSDSDDGLAKFTYTAPADGTYFLDLYASYGTGDYELSWEIVAGGTGDGNDDIASALPVAPAPMPGEVDSQSDPHDVFAVYALPGQHLTLKLDGPADADFDVSLFGPDAVDVGRSTPITSSDQEIGSYPESIIHTASVPGTYYVDVFAFEGTGPYTLDIARSHAPVSLTLAAPASVVYGVPALFTGALRRTEDGAALPGAEIRIEGRRPGATEWQPYGTTTTGAEGAFSATITSTEGTALRASFAGDANYLAADATEISVIPADSPTMISIDAAPRCAYRASTPITGSLATVRGVPLAGKPVVVEAQPYGSSTWQRVAVVGTAADGSFSAPVVPTRRTVYRVRFEGAVGYLPVTSESRTVTPRAYLTRPSAARVLRAGQAFTSVGYLKPRHAAGATTVKIDCYRLESGAWKLKKRVWAKNSNYSSYTRYSKRLSLPSKGQWKLVASVSGDWKHAYTQTSPRLVTVR